MTGPKMDDVPAAVAHAVAEAIGSGAYYCNRVWGAWHVGTMGPGDFHPIAEDGDHVAEIAMAAITAWEAGKPKTPQQRVAWASTGATGQKVVAMPGLSNLPYGDYDLYASPTPAFDIPQLRVMLKYMRDWCQSDPIIREKASELLAQIDGQPERHPDDLAVDAFAEAMKAKLAAARAKGRAGWNGDEPGMQQRLSDMLREHVAKGDPVDVANFAMFLHQRGERIDGPAAINLEQFLRLSDSWLAQAERVRALAPDKAIGLWAAAKELRDLLALIDGQVQRDDERMVASPDISFDEFRAWMRGEQPTKGEGEKR